MTYEEFLEALRGNDTLIFRLEGVGETECATKDLTEIESAVRKQISLKPVKVKGMSTLRCPVCNGIVETDELELGFCDNCGQKIDWR